MSTLNSASANLTVHPRRAEGIAYCITAELEINGKSLGESQTYWPTSALVDEHLARMTDTARHAGITLTITDYRDKSEAAE